MLLRGVLCVNYFVVTSQCFESGVSHNTNKEKVGTFFPPGSPLCVGGFFPQRQTYLPLEFVALIFLCTVWHSAISLHKYAEISVLASTYVEALTITPYIE